jgi:hypothetical protein
MSLDKRVTAIGIFNSGSTIVQTSNSMPKGMAGLLPLPNKGSIPDGSKFKVPTFFLGGWMDIASAKVGAMAPSNSQEKLATNHSGRAIKTTRACLQVFRLGLATLRPKAMLGRTWSQDPVRMVSWLPTGSGSSSLEIRRARTFSSLTRLRLQTGPTS